MSLDEQPSDAELLRRLKEREDRRNARGLRVVVDAATIEARSPKKGAFVEAAKRVLGTKTHRNAPRAGVMNRTETLYSQRLDALMGVGEVEDWKYGSLSLRLAKRTWYRPDFFVTCLIPCLSAGVVHVEMEIHEVKGHWEDDARAKFKIAAELYPMFVFRAVRRVRGEFQVIETLND